MLKGRWVRITRSVTRWHECYEGVTRNVRSGNNMDNIMCNTHNSYLELWGSRFSFVEQWKMMQKFSKWETILKGNTMPTSKETDIEGSQSSGKRVRLDEDVTEMPTPQSGQQSVNDETIELTSLDDRPEGIKKAKSKGKKRLVGRAPPSDESWNKLQTALNEKAKNDAEKTAMEVELVAKQMQKIEKEAEVQKMTMWNMLYAKGENNLTPIEKKIMDRLTRELGFYD